MPYVDLNTIHNPATGTVAPATWGDQVRDNDEFLIDPPACSVFHSTTQNVSTGTPTFLAANSENYDNDSMHSTVTNTGRVTANTAGRYLTVAAITVASNATGYRSGPFFRVNGAGSNYETTTVVPATGVTTRLCGTRTLVLAAGDYVEVGCYQNSGGTLTVTLEEFVVLFLTR